MSEPKLYLVVNHSFDKRKRFLPFLKEGASTLEKGELLGDHRSYVWRILS